MITLIYDSDPPNPRVYEDNITKIICFHKRYNLGDKHNYRSNDFNNWGEFKDKLIEEEKAIFITPLYLYDHSGITISTKPFSCRWDSGQVGFAYTTEELLKKVVVDPSDEDEIIKFIDLDVKIYDDFIRGNCVGYTITKYVECPHCHRIEDNIVDSCWGFYPDENDKFDYIINECKEFIDKIKEM